MEIRNPGVPFSSKLTFLPHLDKIIAKPSKLLGSITRNSKVFKKPVTKVIIYNAYVRVALEYCSIVCA